MSEAPAGWYPDPNEPARQRYWDGAAWTAQTQVPPGAARSNKGLWLGLGIGGALLLIAMVVGGVLLFANAGEPAATPTSSPRGVGEETSAPDPSAGAPTVPVEVEVPEGWVPFHSEAGVISYAVDPEWDDWGAVFSDGLAEEVATPGVGFEFGGAWLVDGSILDGGTNAVVLVVSDGEPVRSLELQLKGFLIGARSETDSFESINSTPFTTPKGYRAIREDILAESAGDAIAMTIVAVAHEETMVFIQVTALDGTDTHADAAMAIAQSLVINFAPEIAN